MKKFTGSLLTAFILLAFMPASVKAMTEPIATTAPATTATVESTEANALLARLAEIKAMDKSNLKSSEKKQLRKETRAIKSELKALSGGVYLSAGAIIIIVLLLILLL